MVVKASQDSIDAYYSCSTALFHMVVKELKGIELYVFGCSTALFHMVVKGALAMAFPSFTLQYSIISHGSEGKKKQKILYNKL